MFYEELINYLRSDTAIAATVTSYTDNAGSYPAIFADEAEEDVEMPYIIVTIDGDKLPDSVVMTGDVNIAYYDYGKSRSTADTAALAIEDRLDEIRLLGNNLTEIRFTMGSAGYIKHADPRTIHHVTNFSTRAARARWMRNTLT